MKLSADKPLTLECLVENTSPDCAIGILRAALAEDGARTIYPNAQYNLVVLFPGAEDGQRVEECVGTSFAGYTLTDQHTVVTIAPGGAYHFVRPLVAKNDKLAVRLASEPFFLFWHVTLHYKTLSQGGKAENSQPTEQQFTGRYHGFAMNGRMADELAGQ